MSRYSISQIAGIMGVPASTIRYYEKEGLLPDIGREGGRRIFTDGDFKWLKVLNCFRHIGMPIKDIRKFLELAALGDDTLNERYEIILRQKESLNSQIATLTESLKELEYKEWYYKTAIEAGTEAIHKNNLCNADLSPDAIPKENED